LRRLLVICAALAMLGPGCRPRPQATVEGGTGGGGTLVNANISSSGDPIITEFAPDPGPFKTIEVKNKDGSVAEKMVARGDIGKSGGTLMLSTFGTGPKTFNAWTASDVDSDGFGLMMFERLVGIDAFTGQYGGRLAKSFTVSPDGRVYTFILRKGLKWSDGHPLTADDVVFTFNDIIGQGFGNSSRRDVLMVEGKYPKFEKVDDLTVRVTTEKPFAPLLSGLEQAIAPKHVLGPVVKKGREAFNSFWDTNTTGDKMVCSGVFKMVRHVPSQRVELERNPNYFMVDREGHQLPYLDRFVVLIVPDQNTQLMKFLGRELDFMDIRSVRGPDVGKLRPKRKVDNFSLYNLGPDDGTNFMVLNMCRRISPKTKKPYVDPIKQEWFNNVNFRQAINHSMNRQRVVDNVLKGVGAPLYTPESTGCLFFNKDLKAFPQDLDYSAKLLKDAGFVKKPDGKLYDAKGNRVEFTLMTNAGNSVRDGACVTIQNELEKLGMKVNYQPVDFNMLIDKLDQSLDWEAVVMGLSGSRTEPYNGANIWKSNGRLHMFDQRLPNDKGEVLAPDARDWEKRIDALFDQGGVVLDFNKRKKIFDEYQQIIYDQVPFIYTYNILDITALRNSVKNYKPSRYGVFYTPMGSLHNVEEIYFENPSSAASREKK
jgi:peptide/nickel transport system substrate-binding protein